MHRLRKKWKWTWEKLLKEIEALENKLTTAILDQDEVSLNLLDDVSQNLLDIKQYNRQKDGWTNNQSKGRFCWI